MNDLVIVLAILSPPLVGFCTVAFLEYNWRRKRKLDRIRLSNEARNLRLKARWEARNGNMDESFRLYDEAAKRLINAGEFQP